jgi:serine/threonine-protein kinase
MQELVGRILGHYRIAEKIGAGGMGEVYRAHDDRLDRDVAVKVLPEELAANPERLARFEREAKAVAQLAHPNILAIHDFGAESGITFAVMELLEGQSLREVLSTTALTQRKAVEFARSIADGLAAAHDKGIIHRDLKPENVFLTKDGQIKILDFGLAKTSLPEGDLGSATPTEELQTRPGGLLGTVPYMAPEQVQGEPVDGRSDIFALGVVLYEMLTGRRPFGGSTAVETAAAILKEDPEPMSSVLPGVSPTLADVVSTCLEKRPEDRFSSARDLSLTLAAVDVHGQTSPGADGSPLRRRWVHVLAVATAAVIAVLFLLPPRGLFQRGGDTPSEPAAPRIVVLPFENLGLPDDAYFADGMTEEITARLTSINGLEVISRTSAKQYADTEKSIPQIGRELNVGYVLEGSVRWARSGNGESRIRITPQLIRVGDDAHLWAETYDRILDDIFAVQSEISFKVADHLGLALSGADEGVPDILATNNLEAYQAFLRGRHYATRPHFTLENWGRAMAAYQLAVDLDPDFGLAHAHLAAGHARFRYLGHDLTPERLQAADEAAARALTLARESPRVHYYLGYYWLWAYRDVDRALEEFTRASSVWTNNAAALQAKGNMFLVQGRWDEALQAFRRAFDLSPRSAVLATDIALVLWSTRRYPQAVAAADEAINIAPDAVWPYLYKAFALWSWHGDLGQTRPILEGLPEEAGNWKNWSLYWQDMFEGRFHAVLDRLEASPDEWLRIKIAARPNAMLAAQAHELLGDAGRAEGLYDAARRMLEDEAEQSPQDPRVHSSLGIVYAVQGRRDEAVREGTLACDLLPKSKDGFYYLPYVIDLAHIFTIVGDKDAALQQLEDLLSNPSWISPPFLRMDPRWNGLREDPRFQELLDRYETAR